MRKDKAVESVGDMCSFLMDTRCKNRVIMMLSCVLQGTIGPQMIWEAIPGKEGGRGRPE
jgi:hypothetical protein